MSIKTGRQAKSKLKIFLVRFLLLISFTDLVLSGPSTDYCTIKCGRAKHTVCKRRHKCGPVSGCTPLENTVAFRELMVKQHNEFRNKIASGQDGGSQYGNKGATNMNAVSYDMEMEYVAQCWANMCKKLEHDECRSVKRFLSGQNIYWGSGTNETSDGVRNWYEEVGLMTNPAWIDKFPKKGEPNSFPDDKKDRGHFTQLVWAESKYIGCARVHFGKDNMQGQLICNYGPAGNMLGGSVYKRASDSSQIASECKGGKNDKYTSLCGKIDPIPTEKCWAGAGRMSSKLLLVQFCVVFVYFASRFFM